MYRMPDRFDRVCWEYESGWCGLQLTEYAHSVAHCQLTHVRPIGTHLVMFGEVVGIWLRHRRIPLVYGLRRYTSWPES
ncbi:flavin reductase [Nonomuraea sp. NPDC003707]